jgi:putative ABC transport system permease protein
MIRNYFKIAFRNIVRHKSFAFLNVFGLGIGIAACLLLFIVVRYESNYDQFLPNHRSIYHVVTQDKKPDGIEYTAGIPFPALEALRLDIPQVTTGALFASYGSQVTVMGIDPNVASGKKFIEDKGMFFADAAWFKIFQYKWLSGTPAVLDQPDVTVLTKTMAEKYFGNWQQAIGQFIRLDNALNVKVAGILEDVPANSDFPLAVVTSFITFKNNPNIYNYVGTEWGSTTSNFQLYMSLPDNISAATINKQLLTFSAKNYKKTAVHERTNFLRPLSDIHFDGRIGNLGDHTIRKSTLTTLSLIGIFIIIMACINFINLSTAQAITRSKEIGIRKVLGGRRLSLFWQMMGETAMIVLFSIAIALLMALACLPFIKNVASIEEPLKLFTVPTLLFTLGIGIVVTLFAGFYPSLVLSGFRPMLALKNKITSASIGGLSLRRGLVVMQFAISQVLIIGTIVAITQMSFVRNADLGFSKDAVLVLTANMDSVSRSRLKPFKQDLRSINGVQSATFSSDVPSSDNNWSYNFSYNHGSDENFSLFVKYGDEDYIKTFGLELIAGRSFIASDTLREAVVNETLLKKLGVKDPKSAIGKDIRTGRTTWLPIVGVVKDFKTNSLREETKPTMISTSLEYYSNISVKIKSSNLGNTKESVEKVWDKYFPEYANTTTYMDENINNFYRQETQLALLYKLFAGIAILISCLGLYGLVSFMAVQRTKEVGVRKVLGASVANIVYLFSKEFTILIVVAFVIAAPLAWYMMKEWLGNFAYRISLGVGVFAVAVLISVVIAWLTVGYKSVRAAMANPVKSLRAE